jgi:hypothetical protein
MSLFKIRITEAQIEALISQGYLGRRNRNDVTAIGAAAEAWLVDAMAARKRIRAIY